MDKRRKTGPRESRRARLDDKLTHSEELFALEYLTNKGNGAAAYRASHPNCHSDNAASAAASRMLRRVKVQRFLAREYAPRLERLRMDADEALYLISCDARADIRELFDEEGHLLPIHRWPESIALSVKTFRPGRYGARIVLNDKLAALKIILEHAGRLKRVRNGGIDALAQAIRGDLTGAL